MAKNASVDILKDAKKYICKNCKINKREKKQMKNI